MGPVTEMRAQRCTGVDAARICSLVAAVWPIATHTPLATAWQ